ncbi:hypothetical protein NKH18_01540 [Streptomyces sp. M10(2022)]
MTGQADRPTRSTRARRPAPGAAGHVHAPPTREASCSSPAPPQDRPSAAHHPGPATRCLSVSFLEQVMTDQDQDLVDVGLYDPAPAARLER